MLKNKPDRQLREQQICLTCGFCCDGTLFYRATLEPLEKGNLPENMEKSYYKKDDKEYFKLPCFYFDKKCTIYNKKKAHICSAFRCQLLENFSNNKISLSEALQIIRNSKQIRDELLEEYNKLSGIIAFSNFSELKINKDKNQKEQDLINCNSIEWKIFNGKYYIFESLLIKYFKSEKNFQEMIDTEIDKTGKNEKIY
jgi:hypothetical protein